MYIIRLLPDSSQSARGFNSCIIVSFLKYFQWCHHVSADLFFLSLIEIGKLMKMYDYKEQKQKRASEIKKLYVGGNNWASSPFYTVQYILMFTYILCYLLFYYFFVFSSKAVWSQSPHPHSLKPPNRQGLIPCKALSLVVPLDTTDTLL